MDLYQIFYDFFAKRIAEQGQYNPVEYIVYGAIMLFLAFFVIFPLLHKRGIKFDSKFLLALLPYILFGSALRVLEDMVILPSSWNPLEFAYYLVTPGIWLLIAAVTILGLAISILLAKRFKVSFHKTFAAIGLILALPLLAFELLYFSAWTGVLAVLALSFFMLPVTWIFLQLTAPIITFIAKIFGKVFDSLAWKNLLRQKINLMAVFSQALDGSATLVATQFFFCGEQHPLSGYLLELFPLSFVFAKVALVLVIIHYVDKEIKNENLRGFIKIVVAILGFATGLRDILTLGVGTCL